MLAHGFRLVGIGGEFLRSRFRLVEDVQAESCSDPDPSGAIAYEYPRLGHQKSCRDRRTNLGCSRWFCLSFSQIEFQLLGQRFETLTTVEFPRLLVC